jgi:hypothetical protein
VGGKKELLLCINATQYIHKFRIREKSNKSITTIELQDQKVITKARTDQELRYIRVSSVLYSLVRLRLRLLTGSRTIISPRDFLSNTKNTKKSKELLLKTKKTIFEASLAWPARLAKIVVN